MSRNSCDFAFCSCSQSCSTLPCRALPLVGGTARTLSVCANHWFEAPMTSGLGCCLQPAGSKVARWGWRPRQWGRVISPRCPMASRMLRSLLQFTQRTLTLAAWLPPWSSISSRGWLASAQFPPRWTNDAYGKSSRCPAWQTRTKRAATASGRLPLRLAVQLSWKKRAWSGRRGLAFSNLKIFESRPPRALQAVQRSHWGKGRTGTPTRDAGPLGSLSVPSIQGAGRNWVTWAPYGSPIRPLTARSSRGSFRSAHSNASYCQSSMPRTRTAKLGRSTRAPTPPVYIRWLGRTDPTRRRCCVLSVMLTPSSPAGLPWRPCHPVRRPFRLPRASPRRRRRPGPPRPRSSMRVLRRPRRRGRLPAPAG